ncbi:hypothetical protein [Streptomyces sp. NPDC056672]|uniref:hypothetical protein n=1 Tax=Streptomyces sp. NPDC056672 TaxID=3345906 RepID=UPI0036981F74
MDTYQLFTVDGSSLGPYAALPVPVSWNGYDPICVTRSIAEQIADDLNWRDAGCGLTADWDGPNLVLVWDQDHRGDAGSETFVPGPDGLYRIGGLWPWMEWEGDTAGQQAIRALGERGISADYEYYEGKMWLVITRDRDARDQSLASAACLLLHIFNEAADEDVDVNRAPVPLDRWRVFSGTFEGEPLIEFGVDRLDRCVEFIAAWVASNGSAAAAQAIVIEQRRAVLRATVLPRTAAPEYTVSVNGDTATMPWGIVMASAQKSIRAGASITPGDAGTFTLTAPGGGRSAHFQPA